MRKFLFTAVISALLFMLSCFERNDMYDYAKNGVPVIYAVIGTCQGAVIATEEGYFKKYEFTGHSGSGAEGIFRIRDNIVMVENDGGNLYFYKNEYSDSWTSFLHSSYSYLSDSMFVKFNGELIYADMEDLYRFDSGMTKIADFTGTVDFGGGSLLAITTYNNAIYILDDNPYTYRYSEGVLSDATSIFFTPGTTLKTFEIKDNTVYIGYKDAFKYNTLGSTSAYTSITPPVLTQSYSVYSSSNIYAVNYDTGTFKIHKFNGTGFTFVTSITGSTGNIYVRHLSSEKLVIGISYSADSNGLYILNLTDGIISKLSSDSITLINVE